MKNPKRKTPFDLFFSLGDKVTGGDPVRKASFDYYLMWVMFFAFGLIAYSNFNAFYITGKYSNLGWGFVVLAILWFQYWSLRMARDARKMMREQKAGVDYNKVDSVKDMMEMTKEKKKDEK